MSTLPDPNPNPGPDPDPPPPGERSGLGLGELMAIVAGAGVGLWLSASLIEGFDPADHEHWAALTVFALGGASAVGPPLLLLERFRRKRRRRGRLPRWGAGRLSWFAQGASAWLLWPPVIYARATGQSRSTAAVCFFYGTPLMAISLGLALLAGRRVGPSRRRAGRRASGREAFGLALAVLWACTGLYVLALIYGEDFD